MQESYISLDPALAEAQVRTQRQELWRQRVFEARGGQVAADAGMTFGVTAVAIAAAYFKKRGLKITPFAAHKIPHYAGIAFWFFVGHNLGHTLAEKELGDRNHKVYLRDNKDKILSGEIVL